VFVSFSVVSVSSADRGIHRLFRGSVGKTAAMSWDRHNETGSYEMSVYEIQIVNFAIA